MKRSNGSPSRDAPRRASRYMTREWTIGTRLDGRLIKHERHGHYFLTIVVAPVDGREEAFVMIGNPADPDVDAKLADRWSAFTAAPGQQTPRASIEFTKGGPMGGYWRVVAVGEVAQ